jgi:hypothetical protein
MAIRGVRDLAQRWIAVPPGGKLRPSWPLERGFFAGAPEGTLRPGNDMVGHDLAAQNVRICVSVFLINTRYQPRA